MATYTAHITNTKVNKLSLMYRVPASGYEEGVTRPIVTIVLESRAFRTPVQFASEEHFLAFRNQNASLLENGTILLGDKVKEKEAETINERNAKEEVKEVREQKEKVVNSIASAVSGKKSKMKIKVEKDSE